MSQKRNREEVPEGTETNNGPTKKTQMSYAVTEPIVKMINFHKAEERMLKLAFGKLFPDASSESGHEDKDTKDCEEPRGDDAELKRWFEERIEFHDNSQKDWSFALKLLKTTASDDDKRLVEGILADPDTTEEEKFSETMAMLTKLLNRLSVHLVLLIMSHLSLKDAARLCRASSRFNSICEKYKVIERLRLTRQRVYVMRGGDLETFTWLPTQDTVIQAITVTVEDCCESHEERDAKFVLASVDMLFLMDSGIIYAKGGDGTVNDKVPVLNSDGQEVMNEKFYHMEIFRLTPRTLLCYSESGRVYEYIPAALETKARLVDRGNVPWEREAIVSSSYFDPDGVSFLVLGNGDVFTVHENNDGILFTAIENLPTDDRVVHICGGLIDNEDETVFVLTSRGTLYYLDDIGEDVPLKVDEVGYASEKLKRVQASPKSDTDVKITRCLARNAVLAEDSTVYTVAKSKQDDRVILEKLSGTGPGGPIITGPARQYDNPLGLRLVENRGMLITCRETGRITYNKKLYARVHIEQVFARPWSEWDIITSLSEPFFPPIESCVRCSSEHVTTCVKYFPRITYCSDECARKHWEVR